VQLVQAVQVGRGDRRRHVEPPRIEFGKVCQYHGGGASILADSGSQAAHEIGIADVR